MRLRHPDGQTVYLASTLPTHSEHEVRGVLTHLPSDRVSAPSVSADHACLSLVINPGFASALAGSNGMRRRLQYGLAGRGYEVVTLGGAFAHRSWRSWWTHVLDLARVLADLLPEDTTHGSISTTVPSFGDDPWESAARELEDLSSGLTEIAWHTGSFIRVACEMAEGTLLETIDDAVRLLSSTDPTRIGVCLSPDRLAATAEPPAQALVKLRRARLAVVKVMLTEKAETATRATLTALLGGPHPICDHYEAVNPAAHEAAREEFAALDIDGAGERPIHGLHLR
jgi:hypothetical protein